MALSLLMLCLCLFNAVVAEHFIDNADTRDTLETERLGYNPEAESLGGNPEADHLGLDPDVEHSGNNPGVDKPEVEHSGVNPETERLGYYPEGDNPEVESPGDNPETEYLRYNPEGDNPEVESPGDIPETEYLRYNPDWVNPETESSGDYPETERSRYNPDGDNPDVESSGDNPETEYLRYNTERDNPEVESPGDNPETESLRYNPERDNPEIVGSGDNPAGEGSGDNPEVEGSGDNPEVKGSGDNPETEYMGYNPEANNLEAEHSGNNPGVEHAGNTSDHVYPGVVNNFLFQPNNGEEDGGLIEYNIVAGQDTRQIRVMEDESVVLGSGSVGKNDHVIWTCESQHSKATIGINSNGMYYDNIKQYGDRLHINGRTGSLTITNITTTDAGLYYQDIASIASKVASKKYNVTVFERLSMPRVTGSRNCSSTSERSPASKCVVLCSVWNVTHVSLSWYKGMSLLSSISVSDLNIRLSLPLEVEYHHTNTYTCVVNNPITNITQHLNIDDVCQPCLVAGPRHQPLVGVSVLLLFIIMGICICCCIVRRKKVSSDDLFRFSRSEMGSLH